MEHDLILLGQGPSMDGCPFDAETWATATVLAHKGWGDKPYSKVFYFDLPQCKPDELPGLEIAQARGITIVGGKGLPFTTEVFPAKKIIERFESFFFLNDMSYMIAMALYEGYKSLLLWGVDQSGEDIYRGARKHVAYWLGVATGMGVRWELAPNSLLWRPDD